jgi:hypothetical protein
LSLAETLGAQRVELYGADFSYPRGLTYARGTYIYPYFDTRQNRFSPVESLFSAFLYRSPSLTRVETENSWYYRTNILSRYREGLEEKARSLGTVQAVPGMGPSLEVEKKSPFPSVFPATSLFHLFSCGPVTKSAGDFLGEYQKKIQSLPLLREAFRKFPENLPEEERLLLATLLPAGAALKRRRPDLRGETVLEEARSFCLNEINRLLPEGNGNLA